MAPVSRPSASSSCLRPGKGEAREVFPIFTRRPKPRPAASRGSGRGFRHGSRRLRHRSFAVTSPLPKNWRPKPRPGGQPRFGARFPAQRPLLAVSILRRHLALTEELASKASPRRWLRRGWWVCPACLAKGKGYGQAVIGARVMHLWPRCQSPPPTLRPLFSPL